jgi:lipoate-protein ligase B
MVSFIFVGINFRVITDSEKFVDILVCGFDTLHITSLFTYGLKCHHIAEILLMLALNTNQSITLF